MNGRYLCDGPNGYFRLDDLELARRIVALIDPKDDDWTITDTLLPVHMELPDDR